MIPNTTGGRNPRGPDDPRVEHRDPAVVRGERDVRVAADHDRGPFRTSQPGHVSADAETLDARVDEQDLEHRAGGVLERDRDGVRQIWCPCVDVPPHCGQRRVLLEGVEAGQVPDVTGSPAVIVFDSRRWRSVRRGMGFMGRSAQPW
jgi:hypothetical protein